MKLETEEKSASGHSFKKKIATHYILFVNPYKKLKCKYNKLWFPTVLLAGLLLIVRE